MGVVVAEVVEKMNSSYGKSTALKQPDPALRDNILPRFIHKEDEKAIQDRQAKQFLSKSLDKNRTVDRDEIRRMLQSSDDSAARKSTTLQMIEERRLNELRRRNEHNKQIYDTDIAGSGNDFTLPGKPTRGSTLPLEMQNRATLAPNRKVKFKTAKETRAANETAALTEEKATPVSTGLLGLEGLTFDLSANNDVPSPDKANKPLSDLDEISEIMDGIHTGEDAINFFARYGSDTPVKFVNLMQNLEDKVYRPYDLMVMTPYDEQHVHDYYTMSAAGIVHVCPGQPSECTPLSNWLRQSMMFNILRNIPFYKYYLHRKAFTIWKDNVRFLLFTKQRKRISDRYFLARNTSCAPIIEIKKHLLDVQNVKLLHLELRSCDKTFFMEQQSSSCLQASSQFEESIRKIISEVENVMLDVTSLHTSVLQDDDGQGGVLYNDGANPEKAKSLVKIQEEKAERKHTKARAIYEFNTLSEFIRLVDYLTVETLASITINVARSFYEELMKPRKVGIFETTVRFSSEDTVFSPTCNEIRDCLDKLSDMMVNTVSNVNRVSYLNANVSKSSNHTGPNIQSIIRENREFRKVSRLIQEKISTDFERAQDHVLTFESVRPIYLFNATWDFAAYKAKHQDLSSLKAMLEHVINWNKELDKLRNKPIGVLEVDSKRLKGELNPMRDARLVEIKDYMKDIASEKCAQLLDNFKENLLKLSVKPAHLKEFAGHTATVTSMREEERSLFKAASQVDQIYNLLQYYEVLVPPEHLVAHEDLHERLQEYRREMEAADTYKEQKLSEMVNHLDLNIFKLTEQITALLGRIDEPPYTDKTHFEEYDMILDDLGQFGAKLDNIDHLATTYGGYQTLFDCPVTEFTDLAVCREKWTEMKKLWTLVKVWTEQHEFWLTSSFTDHQIEEVDKEVQVFFKDSYACHKKLNNGVTETLKDKISEFKAIMPNVLDLGNPNIKGRHWQKILHKVGISYVDGKTLCLQDMLSAGIVEHKEYVGEISASASGEAQLEGSLDLIMEGWEKIEFIVLNHRDTHGLYILGPFDEIFTQLEDNQVTLQTMLGSRFITEMRDRVEEWEKKLSLLSDTLDEWLACQKNWMYLENIFGAEDIQKQLPAESQKFLVVDRSWKQIMLRTHDNPRVLSALQPLSDGGMNLLDTFLMNNAALENIRKTLEEYLETKRMAFPRFYFLSNDELLEIMSQTRDPHAVQPHMGKCFDAIKRIKFGEGRNVNEIQGFVDPGGEVVHLSENVKAEGPVEVWLLAFEVAMRQTLYNLSKKSYVEYPPTEEGAINRGDWIWSYPAQVVIVIDEVLWTANGECAIRQMEAGDDPFAMSKFLDFSLKQIDAMVELVRTQLTNQQRTLIGALLTIDVHARDVTRTLNARGISSLSDFDWTKQLRYYWDETVDDAFAKQTNSSFQYGYEYLGNGFRLVITPLTDTCYMTLTGALHMRLGGAPAGPAGTGKTETTKDLAKALAVYCVVFNCSDGLDYKVMGRFFSGLAQQGAWACFDEFNRIDIEVLSVIAQQILCIQQAITKNLKIFDFEGQMIPLNYSFGVFITMNPGYAGRTELPDNLKALFRPVAMMVPDYRLIAEIMLFAEGFANALPLSNKMAQLYALSSEQLSKQSHYDFGMRAVKSVLVAAGALKRKEPETFEDLLLIRAMRDSNVPKFLEHDLPLFSGIVQDLFPGIAVPFVDYGNLQIAIEKSLDDLNLQKVEAFITKVIQIHETQLVRHGMMVVGEAGSGKTTNIKVLANALGSLHADGVIDKDGFYKTVDLLILNPKSITAGELYGEFNLLTGEWKDGIVPKLVRDCVNALNEGSDNRKWIVFDGPVDAVWIENMNTVLDDNKTLCLANSERIKLPSTLHMMFETLDLKVASPATVSRCGMVYMEQVHVGIMSLVLTWSTTTLLELVGKRHSKTIVQFIEAHLVSAIEYVNEFCKEKVETSANQLTGELLNLIFSQLNTLGEEKAKTVCKDKDFVIALIIWSIVWSIGANIVDESRPGFQEWLSSRFSSHVSKSYQSLLTNPYNCFIDMSNPGVRPWNDIKPEFIYDPDAPYFNILVPTEDTTCYRYLLNSLMSSNYNVLFMAETGVGKSVVINSFLTEKVSQGKTVSYIVGYSAQTKPSNLRDILETKLEKKRKNLLGPPSGKRMFLFIDDLNMPALETYGAQPPNELLRQVIDIGGFYDVQKLFFKNVQDVVCAAACAPPGGGRNEVSPRLLRHFHMVWLTNLSEAAMCSIFSSILDGFLSHNAPHLGELSPLLVRSSVDIYVKIQKELLPTPLRSHYTFNLRDLSKVFQGILMVQKEDLPDKASLIKLWAHEGARVFRDRLINSDDRDWFNNATLQQLHSSDVYEAGEWSVDDFANIMFGNFCSKGTKKAYKELKDRSKVDEVLVESLDEYNVSFASRMELVFFNDAVHHVSRISRVLAQPRGNALLVGVGGSGRQSLTRMASFIADYKCRQIEITRGYGKNEWHENLKEILMLAGAKNTPSVFLFSDTQIVLESFLEDINNILNSGEVPNLFENDEWEKIVSLVRPLAKKAGRLDNRDGCVQYFIYLVRENLHIVLCMSPIGAGFRTRCRMFPSLVNCCTIDWFNAWPEDALYSVAHKLFDEQKDLGIEDYVGPLSNMCNKVHRTVEKETSAYFKELGRYNYTTPTSYLELIKLYVEILKAQTTKISNNERRYSVGLNKLKETEEMVADLEIKLTEMQPVLVKASEETEVLLVQVTADQKDADAQAAVVEVDVQEANKVAAEVKIIKDDCQKDLDEAMPAYESAVKALSTLDKKSVQEMKAFNNPPEMVKFTLEAVCILMDVKPDWGEAKKLMSKMTFMDELKAYDKDNIPVKLIKKVKKYYDDPRFTPEQIEKQSSAAMCLCMWVRAMVVYDRVAKNIEPKKLALKEAEEKLNATMKSLGEKKAALQSVLDRVAKLQQTLKDTQDKKAALEFQAEQAKKQLVRAGQLLGGLGGEKVRWLASATSLKADLVNLVGDMCLAAGCLAYLGPFTSQFRSRIVSLWLKNCQDLKIPCGQFSLLNSLSEPVAVRKWLIDGLPADDFSCENGLLTTMGRRWPLMIDPQGQANRWIRNMYAESNLQIIKLTEKDFLRTLENGIRYGAPVLLENVGQELDPSLEPVLLKQVFKKGGQMLLRLGDTDVPYSDDFRFLITTKLANPHYMPEVCIKVTVINFTVTMKGLEDQLLVDVIKSERPDLEERRDKLVVSIAADQAELLGLEEQILSMLASASGNILDDEDLINALAKSKTTSTAINMRLTEAEVTTKEINDTREGYRVVATRGSVIYFVVANLALVDPMYQYSLQYYKALFNQRLEKTEKKSVLAERLALLIDDITLSMYTNVCRGLFEKDKLLYSFVVAAKIEIAAGQVSDKEWLAFMVGPVVNLAVTEGKPIPAAVVSAGITEKSWNSIVMMENEMGVIFLNLCADVENKTEEWKKFFVSDQPHAEPLPSDWDDKLTSFQRLLLIRSLREEKVSYAMKAFVGKSIGEFFTESPPFDLTGAYADSQAMSPLIFILSPGADPTDYLLSLAESKGKGGTGLRIISLGQGQGPIAERAIEQSQSSGDWVCLQNCHLAVSWLSKLEQIVESMQNDPDKVNSDFRLWLTSMPSGNFPVPVLQNGIKVTNEPPKGLRANLNRTFCDISSEEYESCSKPAVFKKLAFAAAFFNALILERRKFGAVGWNIPYEWMNSDLKASMTQVRMYVEEQDDVPWETLNVQMADITYGGRVTDVWDKRTISSILRKYLVPDLLSDDFHFTDDKLYFAPAESDIDGVIEYIRNLPLDDAPTVFGLHANASITLQQKESKTLIETVVTCGGGGGGGGGGDDSSDSKVLEVAKRLAERLPGLFDQRKCHEDTFKKVGDAVNSLGVFLGQELVRFNGLVEVMKATLHQLQRAIKGEVVMSGELEAMYNCFVFQKVPSPWESAGYPCLKPLPSWVEDFMMRIKFMGDWLLHGPQKSYWLSGFFFPQGFMTAVKQTYSREKMIAVDTLRIGCEMTALDTKSLTSPPEYGAYVYGLFMEAGRFDRETMLMDDSKTRVLFDEMPCIWLKPVITEDYNPTNVYNCPLYKTSIRAGTLSTTGHSTNFVVALPIPTSMPENHWIRRGCAMLCMLDE